MGNRSGETDQHRDWISETDTEMQMTRERTFYCRICGEPSTDDPILVQEMMFGLGETTPYQECGRCGCLQIYDYPTQMEPFYPGDYYAYQPIQPEKYLYRGRIDRFRRKVTLWNHLMAGNLLGQLNRETTVPFPEKFRMIRESGVKPWNRILDVGAGNGRFLCELYRMGFSDLTGVDPFIETSFSPIDGVQILKRQLNEIPGSYDLITMHHVLEHMPEQFDVLRNLRKRLNRGGTILIRIPVKNRAWEQFRENWVQLDAPRHFYLHTETSFRRIARRAGLRVTRVIYDSTSFQFWGSEQYRNGITLRRDERSLGFGSGSADSDGAENSGMFTREQLQQWKKTAEEWNRKGLGDQAAFYLERA